MKARDELESQLRSWKAETQRLPDHLVRVPPRVRAAARGRARLRPARRRAARALALAASLLLAALALGVALRGLESPSAGGIDIVGGEALRALAAAESAHSRTARRLAGEARAMLARAGRPGTPAAEAARLVAYRERLDRLEQSIERSKAFLEGNPYHAPARLSLLRAYERRSELLLELTAAPRMLT